VQRVRDELLRVIDRLPIENRKSKIENALLKLPLYAYPDRVCRRRGSHDTAVMVAVAVCASRVIQRSADEILPRPRRASRSSHPKAEALVRIASAIEPQWLEEMFPHEIRRERNALTTSSAIASSVTARSCIANLLRAKTKTRLSNAENRKRACSLTGRAIAPMKSFSPTKRRCDFSIASTCSAKPGRRRVVANVRLPRDPVRGVRR
jgi:ATP-dependent helicase HrpB